MENTPQNIEQQPNVAIIGGNGVSLTVAGALAYNADAQQAFILEITDDGGKYEITQIYSGLRDDVLEQFDKMREVSLETSGKNTDLNTDSIDADNYLFKELCVDIRGYEGEKPENWRDLVDYDEKKFGIGKLLGVKIITSDKEKEVVPRKWGAPVSSNTVELKVRFGEEILSVKAHFGTKTPADVAAYSVIKSRVSLVDRDLDDSAIKIPASMKRKAALFDKLNPRVEGYDGRVPLHHKAAFVTGLFEPKIASAEKK